VELLLDEFCFVTVPYSTYFIKRGSIRRIFNVLGQPIDNLGPGDMKIPSPLLYQLNPFLCIIFVKYLHLCQLKGLKNQ